MSFCHWLRVARWIWRWCPSLTWAVIFERAQIVDGGIDAFTGERVTVVTLKPERS